MSNPTIPASSLLVLEPIFLLRRTVTAVARDLGLAQISEATSVEVADRLVNSRRFDALLISLDADHQAMELLERVRNGRTRCASDTPVTVLAEVCDASTILRLKQLDVRRVLLKPFKVKGVLESIDALLPQRRAA